MGDNGRDSGTQATMCLPVFDGNCTKHQALSCIGQRTIDSKHLAICNCHGLIDHCDGVRDRGLATTIEGMKEAFSWQTYTSFRISLSAVRRQLGVAKTLAWAPSCRRAWRRVGTPCGEGLKSRDKMAIVASKTTTEGREGQERLTHARKSYLATSWALSKPVR